MLAAPSYLAMLQLLGPRIAADRRPAVLAVIVFAQPDNAIAKDEILPNLTYLHARTGPSCHFLFAGYSDDPALLGGGADDWIAVCLLKGKQWFYSGEEFNAVRSTMETLSTWRYSGGADIIVADAVPALGLGATIRFTEALPMNLEALEADGTFLGCRMLFERLIRHAESESADRPTYTFSDKEGMNIVRRSAWETLVSFLPEALRPGAHRAKHLVVRNLAPH